MADHIQCRLDLNSVTIPNGFIEQIQLKQLIGQRIDTVTVVLNNRNAQYNASVLRGHDVDLWADLVDGQTTKRFTGVVRNRKVRWAMSDELNSMTLRCEDKSSSFKNRFPNEVYEEDLYADISDIVKDLISKYAPGITTTNVANTSIQLDKLVYNWNKSLFSCLAELAELVGFDFFVDETSDLHFQDPDLAVNVHTVTEDLIDPSAFVESDLDDQATRVTMQGGYDPSLDYEQTDISVATGLDTSWIADEYTPSRPYLAYILIYCDQEGSPDETLNGKIVVDNNGTPQGGAEICRFTVLGVNATAGWRFVPINLDITHVHPFTPGVEKIWICLEKHGDGANRYRWYNDGGTSNTYATSSDGETWSVSGSGPDMAFRAYYGARVIIQEIDTALELSLGEVIEVIEKDEKWTDRDLVRSLAHAKMTEYAEELKKGTLWLLCPSVVIRPGDKITLNLPGIGESGTEHIVTGITWDLRPGTGDYTVKLDYGALPPTIGGELAMLLQEQRRIKFGSEPQTAIVEQLWPLADALAISDSTPTVSELTPIAYYWDAFYWDKMVWT